MNCPLCGGSQISLITSRKNVPVLQNVLCRTREKSAQIPRGDIEFYSCNTCDFVFNAQYKQVDYNGDYENYQGYSTLFDNYLNENAQRIVEYILQQNKSTLLLEIGCGQGDFLRRIMQKIPNNKAITAIGFDPAYEESRGVVKDSRCHIIPKYFNEESVADILSQKEYPVKVCVSRHVIEHIPDPNMLIKEISKLKGEVQIFLETPDIHWILINNAFEDIVYEHCSFYSPKSAYYLLQKYGFSLTGFRNTFNDQYMWLEAKKTPDLQKQSMTYSSNEHKIIQEWKSRVEAYQGGYIVWGAGAKGVAFLNAVDPHGKYVSKVIDINPKKQGMFLPCSGHEIVSPEYLKTVEENITLIVMNENYLDEIKNKVSKMGIKNISYLTLHE